MPRGPRLDGSGAAHHVMIRGIERRKIFLDGTDEEDFLARLDRLLPEEGWRCFAWALMPNHVHLVIQGSGGRLSRLMARLNTGYARRFNIRHDRCGYLFQNRFKSRVVRDEADLQGLVRYVLRNPLDARLVTDLNGLEAYGGCGYGALVGRCPPRPFESVGECLSLLATDPATARARLRHWMAEDARVSASAEPPLPACGEPAADAVKPTDDQPALRDIEVRVPAAIASHTALELLIQQLCAALGTEPESIRTPGGRGPSAELRAIICSTGVDELLLPRRAIGNRLGISPTAVSHAARKGRSQLRRFGIRIHLSRTQPPRSEG
ncbi:MAG: transposase [Deltaproteobacteria bacterium]|nr:transposase [Deltaproteobacteria bacterium]